MNEYDIPADNVVRHSDCSGDDVRGKGKGKTDPGSAFDWERFKKEIS
jgi:N-acetyl-anhydromuramyl-L-alanine amidase AmpD